MNKTNNQEARITTNRHNRKSSTKRIVIEQTINLAAISEALIIAGIHFSMLLPAVGIPLLAIVFYGGLWHSSKEMNKLDRELDVQREMHRFLLKRLPAELLTNTTAGANDNGMAEKPNKDLPKLSWREARTILKHSDRTAVELFEQLRDIFA